MREVGLIFRTKFQWLPKKPLCESDGHDFTAVGLREIHPLLVMYGVGMVVSLAIFSLEVYAIQLKVLLNYYKVR